MYLVPSRLSVESHLEDSPMSLHFVLACHMDMKLWVTLCGDVIDVPEYEFILFSYITFRVS